MLMQCHKYTNMYLTRRRCSPENRNKAGESGHWHPLELQSPTPPLLAALRSSCPRQASFSFIVHVGAAWQRLANMFGVSAPARGDQRGSAPPTVPRPTSIASLRAGLPQWWHRVQSFAKSLHLLLLDVSAIHPRPRAMSYLCMYIRIRKPSCPPGRSNLPFVIARE